MAIGSDRPGRTSRISPQEMLAVATYGQFASNSARSRRIPSSVLVLGPRSHSSLVRPSDYISSGRHRPEHPGIRGIPERANAPWRHDDERRKQDRTGRLHWTGNSFAALDSKRAGDPFELREFQGEQPI